MTPEQKTLFLSFAELEKEKTGTVNGSSQTKSGIRIHNSNILLVELVYF